MSAPEFDASTRQRLAAWERIAEHPFFADCYRGDETLLDAMVAKLDQLPERDRMLESAVRAQIAADLEAECNRYRRAHQSAVVDHFAHDYCRWVGGAEALTTAARIAAGGAS